MKINCPDNKTNSTMSRMSVRKEKLDECIAIHKINSASSPDSPDDSGVLCKVLTKSPTASSSSINASDFHRYSRSELYLLRNDIRSKRRPECALRTELMSLGVWKLNSGQQNGNDAGSNTAMGCGNSNVSSAVSHIHTRGQRSPSRRTNIASTEHLSGTQYGHANQRNYVDQRTVSSAHLMPAFAKRRIGASSVVGAGLFSNSASSGSISTVRPETPNELVTDPEYSYRQRCKEQFSDRQRTEQSSSVNYLSPQRKNPGGCENDRSERTEVFNSGSISPGASSAHSTTRHCLTMCGNERRIGSGRLLHCDVNWDYCADKDKMKNITDKDSSGIHHPHTQRTRFNERERNERSNFSERRTFERRSSDFEGPDKLDNRNSTAHYNAGSRRFDPENISNRVPGSEQQNTRPRRYYNERSDEPEWFSGGPTSQNDTIELRGFDELDDQCGGNNKNSRRKFSESSSSRATRSINLSNSVSKDPQLGKELHENETIGSCTGNTKNTPCYKKERSTKQSDEQETTIPSKNEKKRHVDQLNLNEEEKENAKYDKKNYFQFGFSDFNFDAFFNVDPMNNSIMGTDSKHDSDLGMAGSSRFSRWFVSKSSQPEAINRNTFNVDNDTKSDGLLLNLRDIKKTETEGLLYSSVPSESSNVKQSNTLMQFLQRSRLPPTLSEGVQPLGGITSVEELEASMRKMPAANESTSNEDKQKKSLSKDNLGVVVSLPQQTDPLTQTTAPTTPKDTEAFKKLLEQLGSANELDHHYSQTTYELQKENQERHTSLKTSQYVTENTFPPQLSQNEEYKIFIKQQELMHQQQRRLQHKKPIPSQLPQNESAFSAISSFIPTINENPGIQNLNMLQGVPCSREIEFHTQNIQNTIMKKKLEEQEHLRKRQETQKPNSIPFAAKLSLEGEMSQKTLHRYQYQLKSSNGVSTQLSPQNSQILQKPSQQHHSTHSTNTQPQQRHNNSPTPLAFTPTSVLRKMTAEKENTSSVPSTQYQQTANQMHTSNSMPQRQQSQIHVHTANKNLQSSLNQHQLVQPQSHQQPPVINSQPPAIQPRMILGGGVQQQQIQHGGKQSTPQQHALQAQKHSSSIHATPQSQRTRNSQQQLKWQVPSALSQHQISISKPIGRPILKGPLQNQQQKQQQLITPMLFASKIEFQQIQQQQQKSFPHLHQQPFPISQQTQHTAHTNIMTHVQQQLFQNQQQQRAAALHRAQHIQMQHMHQQQHLNTPTGLIGSNQSHCAATGSTTTGNSTGIINYQRDGGLSPTSNQLAQWFSPELLAQASAGKLPLLNVNQALSLEEFERSIQHSSTSVHN